MTFQLIVPDTTAVQLIPWFKDGGVLVWHSLDLGNLDQQWITPLDEENKPHWAACSRSEAEEITDPGAVAVVILEEVERFYVHLRVSGNGLSTKLTDEASQYLKERLVIKGRTEWASYRFDYESQEAVILDTTQEPGSLADLIEVGDDIGLPI